MKACRLLIIVGVWWRYLDVHRTNTTVGMGDLRARGGHTSDMEDEMVDMESGLDV